MSFSNWRQRVGRFQSTALLIAAAVICIWAGYEIGNARLQYLEDERTHLTERTQRLQQTIENLEYQTNILRVERDVDRVAIENLQRDLRDAHNETAVIRRELAFFQRVMAPEMEADGVAIDSLMLQEANAGVYHFRLILVRLERAQQSLAQGTFRLIIRGRRAGEVAEYDILELANLEPEGGERSFAMNYFSRLDGTFQLPEGLEPEAITVSVRTRQGRQTSQQFTWNELIGTEAVPIPLDDSNDQSGLGR